jgi:hypothetical protein
MRFFIYQETKDILLQKVKPSSLISEFGDWFFQEYSTKLLNIDIHAYRPKNEDVRYGLSIITESHVESFKDARLPDLPAKDVTNIKNKFIELSTKHNFANEHKINKKDNSIQSTTKRNFAQLKNLENIVNVTLYVFSAEAKTSMIWGTIEEATAFLRSKYPEILRLQIWTPIAIIYNTDAQAAENENKGINKTIMNDYFGFIKMYDELNFFTEPISGLFVSQETLNRSFMGELHYYMR